MRTKTLFLALFFVTALVFSNVAIAQSTTGQAPAMLTPEQKIDKRLAHAQKKLGLTDAQVAQLRTILTQNMSKIQADREALRNAARGTDTRKDANKQLRQDHKAVTDQLKGVLTPDQLKKFKAMRLMQIERREKRLKKEEQKLK